MVKLETLRNYAEKIKIKAENHKKCDKLKDRFVKLCRKYIEENYTDWDYFTLGNLNTKYIGEYYDTVYIWDYYQNKIIDCIILL